MRTGSPAPLTSYSSSPPLTAIRWSGRDSWADARDANTSTHAPRTTISRDGFVIICSESASAPFQDLQEEAIGIARVDRARRGIDLRPRPRLADRAGTQRFHALHRRLDVLHDEGDMTVANVLKHRPVRRLLDVSEFHELEHDGGPGQSDRGRAIRRVAHVS